MLHKEKFMLHYVNFSLSNVNKCNNMLYRFSDIYGTRARQIASRNGNLLCLCCIILDCVMNNKDINRYNYGS